MFTSRIDSLNFVFLRSDPHTSFTLINIVEEIDDSKQSLYPRISR